MRISQQFPADAPPEVPADARAASKIKSRRDAEAQRERKAFF